MDFGGWSVGGVWLTLKRHWRPRAGYWRSMKCGRKKGALLAPILVFHFHCRNLFMNSKTRPSHKQVELFWLPFLQQAVGWEADWNGNRWQGEEGLGRGKVKAKLNWTEHSIVYTAWLCLPLCLAHSRQNNRCRWKCLIDNSMERNWLLDNGIFAQFILNYKRNFRQHENVALYIKGLPIIAFLCHLVMQHRWRIIENKGK